MISRWFAWAPPELVSLVAFLVFATIALVLHAILMGLAQKLAGNSLLWRSVVRRTQGVVRIALLAVAVALVIDTAPLTIGQRYWAQRTLALSVIALIAWLAWTALRVWIVVYLRRFETVSSDPFLARKHKTQTHILQRVAGFAIWLTAIGVGLMSFDGVREYGVSILASAGAAGLILGLALQPVLQNLIAGIQIAVTQPVRIGDSLTLEGEYGTVEDIKATYVVIRLWDLRRMVIPLSYFLDKPFQNWTRESTDLLGSVMMYLDYSVPIDALRAKAKAAIEAHPKWDRKAFGVQITDLRDRVVEVRVLVSASDSGRLFDLRCDLREQLIGWLQQEHPHALPHLRAVVDGEGTGAQKPPN